MGVMSLAKKWCSSQKFEIAIPPLWVPRPKIGERDMPTVPDGLTPMVVNILITRSRGSCAAFGLVMHHFTVESSARYTTADRVVDRYTQHVSASVGEESRTRTTDVVVTSVTCRPCR